MPPLEEARNPQSDMRTECRGNCEHGDELFVGLEACLSYDGTKCSCRQCPNFHICHVWAPQCYFDCHGGLCTNCDLLLGHLTFRDATTPCPACTGSDKKAHVQFPGCDHWVCVDCMRKIKFEDDSRCNVDVCLYGCPPCPNGCSNPPRGEQCYCEEYDLVKDLWERRDPSSYDRWNKAEEASISKGEPQGSFYATRSCPLCLRDDRDCRAISPGAPVQTDYTSPEATTSKKRRIDCDAVHVPCALDAESIALKSPDAYDVFGLLYELQDDRSGFVANSSLILQAWKDERLYCLAATETADMYNRGVGCHEWFCRSSSGRVSLYMFPCFALLSEENKHVLDILWVHSRMRRKGLGTHLIRKLAIQSTSRQLPGSEQFWGACGVQQSLSDVQKDPPDYDKDELFGYWDGVGPIPEPPGSPSVNAIVGQWT